MAVVLVLVVVVMVMVMEVMAVMVRVMVIVGIIVVLTAATNVYKTYYMSLIYYFMPEHFTYINSSSPHKYYIPNLQVKKLRTRGYLTFAQGHIARRDQSLYGNLGILPQDSVFLTSKLDGL